jgi:ribonuclease HI
MGGGGGVLVRDSQGKVVEARYMFYARIEGVFSPTVAESLAALDAIDLCRNVGLTKVHLEGDAKIIIDAVNCEEADWSRLGHVVEDIKAELCWFNQRKMSFVNRGGNQAAHGLANFAVKNGVDIVWSESPD